MTRNAARFVLAIAALACTPVVLAKSSDRNQTMTVNADRNDCSLVEDGPCVFTGSVRITQGTLDIRAARAEVRRAGGEPVAVKLTGSPVRLNQEMDNGGTMNATAAQIDYDLQQDTIVFSGDAVVRQSGRGSIEGARIVYNTRTSQVQAGGGGRQVTMQFEPRTRARAPEAKAPDTKPDDGQN